MQLEWKNERVPVSTRFDDPYYSLENGVAETEHVFLAGNDLPARFTDGFHIAELGFGTGLNLLVTVMAWRAAGVPGKLKFTSFEQFPLGIDDMARAHHPFGQLSEISAELLPHLKQTAFETDDLIFDLVVGDARDVLPPQGWQADAWFLDGFSPAKNPELWSPELMQAVGDHTVRGGTFATYTAAGHVRHGLEAAGFFIERVPGYGRKRHMTRGAKT